MTYTLMKPSTFDFVATVNPNTPSLISRIGQAIRKLVRDMGDEVDIDHAA